MSWEATEKQPRQNWQLSLVFFFVVFFFSDQDPLAPPPFCFHITWLCFSFMMPLWLMRDGWKQTQLVEQVGPSQRRWDFPVEPSFRSFGLTRANISLCIKNKKIKPILHSFMIFVLHYWTQTYALMNCKMYNYIYIMYKHIMYNYYIWVFKWFLIFFFFRNSCQKQRYISRTITNQIFTSLNVTVNKF